MPAAIQPTYIGQAYVFGLDGTLAYTGLATTANELRSLEYRDEVKRTDVQDKKGQTVGVMLYDPNPKITITFYPCQPAGAASILGAQTNSVLPALGAKVTLAAFPPVVGTAESTVIKSLKWIYLGGGSYRFSNDGVLEMTLPLEKFASDLAATANT